MKEITVVLLLCECVCVREIHQMPPLIILTGSPRTDGPPIDNQLLIIIGASAGGLVMLLIVVVLLVNRHHRNKNKKLEMELSEKK